MRLIDADRLKDVLEKNFGHTGGADVLRQLIDIQPTVDAMPVIRCKDCIYYDPPHIENKGEWYEYENMPLDAFDPITKKYVNVAYGINIGGRCCRDYECGYSEDKRVYVSETNYCGRAERKEE